MATTQSPIHAPDSASHREGVAAADGAVTEPKRGMNMQGYERAHIIVGPAGGANPNVEVLYWDETVGSFMSTVPPDTVSGAGVDTPYQFTVKVQSRRIFVAVTDIAAGTVDIRVSGAELDHKR